LASTRGTEGHRLGSDGSRVPASERAAWTAVGQRPPRSAAAPGATSSWGGGHEVRGRANAGAGRAPRPAPSRVARPARDGRTSTNEPACALPAEVTAGTVVKNSKTSLTTWFWAAYLMTTDKRGLSALLLKRVQVGRGQRGGCRPTGPRTAEGKARSSRNAWKGGHRQSQQEAARLLPHIEAGDVEARAVVMRRFLAGDVELFLRCLDLVAGGSPLCQPGCSPVAP